MPRTQIIGKISPFTGNLLFEILGNLKNYGLGRVVVRNSHKKQFPETCYYIVRKVVPLRETIGPGPEELVYGNVWAEEVFRGRRMKGLKLLQEETFLPDWKLIPKEEEHSYLNIQEKVELKVLPREAPLPPVLSLLAGQKGAPPTMELAYDYPRDYYRQKFPLPPHHDYQVAGEGEGPDYELKVRIPEQLKAGIQSSTGTG